MLRVAKGSQERYQNKHRATTRAAQHAQSGERVAQGFQNQLRYVDANASCSAIILARSGCALTFRSTWTSGTKNDLRNQNLIISLNPYIYIYMSNYCHGLTERGNKLVEQQMLHNCIILYSHVEDLPSPPQSPGLKPRFQPRPDYYRLLMINHHISQASLIAGGIRRVRLCKVEFCVPTSLKPYYVPTSVFTSLLINIFHIGGSFIYIYIYIFICIFKSHGQSRVSSQ